MGQSFFVNHTMKFLVCLCLIAAAFAAEDPLKAILRSPKATLNLYREYKAKEHLDFNGVEDRMRFRIFRRSAELVADENSKEGLTFKVGLNMFSAMTQREKQSYLGLNVTGHRPNPPALLSSVGDSLQAKPPKEKMWWKEGKVTAVKNQGSCGSCWTFGAVGGLETRYADMGGVLRSFSEQEYLDCTYEGLDRDGCN